MHDIRLDREIARELERFSVQNEPFLDDVDHARQVIRERYQRIASRPTADRSGVVIEERSVPSLIDDFSIPVRIYRPIEPASGRGLLWIHGGGFVSGQAWMADECCALWARDARCVIVSVDYRLAPEHPFPTPLEDAHSVLRWVTDNARDLGIDPHRIGVGGDSSGGNLAAGLALLCRDRGGPSLGLQMLLYPVLDDTVSSESATTMLSSEEERDDVALMWTHYLGDHRADPPIYASPARADDLTGLPPAYIAVAQFDFLRDEGIAYAQRLLSAGVDVELHLWPNAPHGFEPDAPDASMSQRSLKEQAVAIARFLATSEQRQQERAVA